MKYYYMDEQEIKIRTNLKKINSISYSYLSTTNKLILTCVLESGEVFSYDTKSKYFDLFFNRLKEVYREEKDIRKIIILDDDLKKLLDSSLECIYPKKITGKTFFSLEKVENQKAEVKSLKPIINELIMLIFGIQGLNVKNISNIKGIKDNFSIIVSTDARDRIIPIKFKKNNDFSYELVLGNMYGFNSVELLVDFHHDGLNIDWKTAGFNIIGSIKYKVAEKLTKEVEVFYDELPIFYEEQEIESEQVKEVEILKQLEELDEYTCYQLDNGMIIGVNLKENIVDTIYITESDILTKLRNCYQENSNILELSCPILSMKRVVENYRIDDEITLSQTFYNDCITEESLYREQMISQVEFNIYYNNCKFNIKDKNDIRYLNCLDSDIVRKILERKDK